MASSQSRPNALWRPPQPEQTAMWKFKQLVEREKGIELKDFNDLHAWSVRNRLAFWSFCFAHTPLIYSGSPSAVATPHDRIDDIPQWFPGVTLNYAENLLFSPLSAACPSPRSTAYKADSKCAIVEVREAGTSTRTLTWGELRDRVAVFAAALKAHGVRTGDRVAVVMGNSIDTLCVFLGATTLGALFSSSSTDMGAKGVLERLRQITPRWVFVDDEALYNGQWIDLREKMGQILEGMAAVEGFDGIVSVPRRVGQALDVGQLKKTVGLEEFLQPGMGKKARDLKFERVPFHEGFLVVYSSGTTGQPKCIVHSVGGVLLGGYKEGALHRSMSARSRVLQFTTTGWIMYLASVQALMFGARLVMYDGSPFLPRVDYFLRLAGEQGVTHLGISPRWLQTLRAGGVVPKNVPGTESLKVVTSTGMVLPTDLFRWFYSDAGFHKHTHLSNVSGGTDLAGAFGDSVPTEPVYDTGGCQGFSLGIDVRVFDSTIESEDSKSSSSSHPPKGREVPVGEPGDLVATAAFPNMPVKFWGDDGGRKYRAAYFERFDSVWTHGDFIQVEPATHSVLFLGRADGVLNPSGIRFGSAEIYSVVEANFAHDVEDSLCIGQRRKGDADESVMLFVKMKGPHTLDASLVRQIKDAIARGLSKRHVPRFVFETPEIPTTVNGKKVELPVKRIVSGERVKPSGTLANPACLEYYYQFVDSEERAKVGVSKL